MSGSVNKVILVGHLGADPEIRHTQDGRAIANLRLATTESWRDKNSGEKREKTEWTTVVIFNEGLAKVAEQYTRKGSKIYVEGALQTRKWQDKEGNDRYSTEVVLQGFNSTLVLLDGKGKDDREDRDDGIQTSSGRHTPTGSRGGSRFTDDDGDIPFACEWR